MPKRTLTPAFINKPAGQLVEAGADRTIWWDTALPGFGLMVTNKGSKSFVVQYRVGGGRGAALRRMTVARYSAENDRGKVEGAKQTTLTEARNDARSALNNARAKADPLAEKRQAAMKTGTLESAVIGYLNRRKQLRSTPDAHRVFKKHVFPVLGTLQAEKVGRADIVRLLDGIAEHSGDRMADAVLAYLRSFFNEHVSRTTNFVSPIVKGMRRTRAKDRMRQRVLTDDELRAIWKAADVVGYPFGNLIQLLLLTAARRTEGAGMNRAERHGEGGQTWIIPASRYKSGSDFLLPLSDAAATLLDGLPTIGLAGFVFTRSGKSPLTGYSKAKAAFDAVCPVRDWRLHDLRRTARSLMSRAGVPADHAERALGHALPTVRGTYDLHSYEREKRAAFEALANQIRVILANDAGKVVALTRRA